MFSVRYMRYYSLNVHNMLLREPICLAFGAGVTCRGLVRHPEAKENPEASRATHEWTDFVRRLVAVVSALLLLHVGIPTTRSS